MDKETLVLLICCGLIILVMIVMMIFLIIIPLINDSDCQQYCNRAGYERHYYSSYDDACDCREAPDKVKECINRCGSKDSHYNEFNGRCYCT